MNEKAETIQTEPTPTEIKEYSPIEAEISKLVADLKGKVYDATTTKGMEALKSDRSLFRKIRTGLEKIRKALKQDSLEYGRTVDREAKRLKTLAETGERPLIELIEAEVERKAKAKAEREQKERERVQKIRNLLAQISKPLRHGVDKDMVIEHLDWLHGQEIVPEFFQEFTGEASKARDIAVINADAVLADIIESEKQAAELEKLRQDNERREKEEAERKAQEEAEASAKTAEEAMLGFPAAEGGLLSDSLEETSPPAREVLAGQTVGGGLIEEPGPLHADPNLEECETIGPDPGTNEPGEGTLLSDEESMTAGDYVTEAELSKTPMPENPEQTPTAAGERALAENPEQQRALQAASRVARGLLGDDAQEPAGADTGEAAATTKAYCFMILREGPTGKALDIVTASMSEDSANRKADLIDARGCDPETTRRVVPVSCWEVV